MAPHFPLLSLLITTPLLGGVLMMFFNDDHRADQARFVALLVSTVTLLLCVPLYRDFDTTTFAMQFVESHSWVQALGLKYALGVDGISMPFIILNCFITWIVVLASRSIQTQVAKYLAAFLFMGGMMNGVFAATDAILFYLFWEATLIPMFLSIGIWGSSNRLYASIKFFLYTFLGSVLMFVALLYLHMKSGSFAIVDLYGLKLKPLSEILIFIGFFLAFAVKVPMWPVHTWLPDAHTEAPTGGSVILAALMLKMGGYGFLRFSLPIVPHASQQLAWIMILLSLVAVVYIGLVAMVQKDMKRLIAYSSIAHMGLVTLGTFMVFAVVGYANRPEDAYLGLQGAIFQMISHGFTSAAMFLGVGVLYDRLHTRLIKDFGGVAHRMPAFAGFFMLVAMANVGLPGTSGFVGEFMIILGTFKVSFWVALFAATTLVLSAAYTLWMYKRVFFGQVIHSGVAALEDLNAREWIIFVLMAATILLFGVYPSLLLKLMGPSVSHLVTVVTA